MENNTQWEKLKEKLGQYINVNLKEMIISNARNKDNVTKIKVRPVLMKADIVDMSKSLMILQICDVPERTKILIDMLKSISIVEVARTGTLALQKCCESE